MNTDNTNTRSVTIKPNLLQWFVTFLPQILVAVAGWVCTGLSDMPLAKVGQAATLVLSLYLCYQLVYLMNIGYHIGSQQMITVSGVFHRERNYMELYRIIDFYEHQTFMQRLCGLKTITICSTDKNTPTLKVIGLDDDIDLVGYLRQLVYYNRKRMGIHEFTNYC